MILDLLKKTVINPIPVSSLRLFIINHPMASSLGLNVKALQRKDGVAVLAGN